MEDAILTLSETAQYLKIAEKTLQRMIRDKKIPCSRVGNQWRFMKNVVDEWLIEGMNLPKQGDSYSLLEKNEVELQLSRLLLDAICPIRAGSKKDILSQLIVPLQKHRLLDSPENYLAMLLKREAMVSTAIGGGLALPHIRRPQDHSSPSPHVVLGISPEGLEYDSLDGEKVHLFFLIFCSSEVVHLRLMSRISSLVKQADSLKDWLSIQNKEEAERLLIEAESRMLGKNL